MDHPRGSPLYGWKPVKHASARGGRFKNPCNKLISWSHFNGPYNNEDEMVQRQTYRSNNCFCLKLFLNRTGSIKAVTYHFRMMII